MVLRSPQPFAPSPPQPPAICPQPTPPPSPSCPFLQLAPLTALKGLALLNLSKCGLEGLPAEVATLPALHTLLLSGNQLRDLPQEGSYLAYLESVDLSLNK